MPFAGLAANPEGPVGAGLDSILVQDGTVIAYASGVTFDEDWELEGIRTLGFYGDRYFKSMGYTARANIETYVLRGADIPGALKAPGWQPDGSCTINTAGLFDFALLDLHTLEVLFTLIACKIGTTNVQFPARGLNTKATTWRVMRALPGLQTS
ncbi:MAG TPA: hypothetical protein PKM65_20185 [Spirochaetota bacterium]|nr:hypothetical protein [Spirochaetota bacterium]